VPISFFYEFISFCIIAVKSINGELNFDGGLKILSIVIIPVNLGLNNGLIIDVVFSTTVVWGTICVVVRVLVSAFVDVVETLS